MPRSSSQMRHRIMIPQQSLYELYVLEQGTQTDEQSGSGLFADDPRKIHVQGYYSNVSTFGDTVVVKAIDLDSPGI